MEFQESYLKNPALGEQYDSADCLLGSLRMLAAKRER
jgi:hypothetical protein